MLVAFLFFITSFNVIAQETIECQKDYCSIPSNIQLIKSSEFLSFSSFDLISQDEDIEIDTTSFSRDFKVLLNSYNHQGINLDVKGHSTKDNKTGSNFFIFADSIGNLNINNKGFDGKIHLNASDICSQDILAGKYGFKIKNLYEERRENDPNLPLSCDDTDLTSVRIHSVHACEENFESIPSDNLTAKRQRIYRQCSGDASRKLCLSKKMKLTCLWYGARAIGDTSCCGTGSLPKINPSDWSCEESSCSETQSGWVRKFSKIKSEYEIMNGLSNDADFLCQKDFPRDIPNNSNSNVFRWYGDFNSYAAVRDFSSTLPNYSERNYYKLEVSPGASLGGGWGVSNKTFDSVTLEVFNGQNYITTSSWVELPSSEFQEYFKCEIINSTLSCQYKSSFEFGGSSYVINRLPSHRIVYFKAKAYYIDKHGNNSSHEFFIKVGHEGYSRFDWSGVGGW